MMPPSEISNVASFSGRHGESKILHIRCSPLPFRKQRRVVLAWARTCPPMGFLGSTWAIVLPGSAITWFVMQMATLNCSASFMILLRTFPNVCCRSESQPRPVKSFLKHAMIESMISKECGLSIIMAAAKFSKAIRCSTVYPRAQRIFSRAYSPSSPYLSAILTILSGLKVPSVSMQITLPLPPPFYLGSWVVTHKVCANCVLPVLNSPKASVMAIVSMPPPSSSSNTGEPVVILTMFFRFWASSLPVMNPWFSSFLAASRILSILASLIPLMLIISFLVAMTMDETVHMPAAFSLAISAALMPRSCSFSIQMKEVCSRSYVATTSSSSCSSFFLFLDLSFSFSLFFIFEYYYKAPFQLDTIQIYQKGYQNVCVNKITPKSSQKQQNYQKSCQCDGQPNQPISHI